MDLNDALKIAERQAAIAAAQGRGDRDELASNASLAAWKAHRSYNSDKGIPSSAWVNLLVRRAIIDTSRAASRKKRKSIALVPEVTPSRELDPCRESQQRERRRELREALKELPPRDRMILELRVLDGLTISEVAFWMHVNENKVKASVAKSLELLRTLIKETPDAID